MTKKITKLAALLMVVAALMAFVGMQASATDTYTETTVEVAYSSTSAGVSYYYTSGYTYQFSVTDGEATFIGGNNYDSMIQVPTYITYGDETYTVTAVTGFLTMYGATTFVIPSTVTTLGDSLFYASDIVTIYYLGTQAQFDAIAVSGDTATVIANSTIICLATVEDDTTVEEDTTVEDETTTDAEETCFFDQILAYFELIASYITSLFESFASIFSF